MGPEPLPGSDPTSAHLQQPIKETRIPACTSDGQPERLGLVLPIAGLLGVLTERLYGRGQEVSKGQSLNTIFPQKASVNI